MAHQPPVSYLFLGSGNFSSPYRFAWANSVYSPAKAARNGINTGDQNNAAARELVGITLTATEYRTREQALECYKKLAERQRTWETDNNPYYRYFDHVYGIQNLGGRVIEGFDATANYPNDVGRFDHIVFENPHTADYGAENDNLKNLVALQSNRALVENAMRQARGHLNQRGTFELLICGWPFQSRNATGNGLEWERGMELQTDDGARRLAGTVGMRFVRREDGGSRWVERNNGEGFQADTTRLIFSL